MLSCKLVIPHTPKPKESVRIGRYRTYNPSAKGMMRSREYVRSFLTDYALPLMSGPLLVITHYRIPAALSSPERKRRPQHLVPHAKRPDGDNLEKFLNDALKGVIWDDDARISWLLRSKSVTKAREGETVLFVRELENSKPNYPLLLCDLLEHIRIESEDEDPE